MEQCQAHAVARAVDEPSRYERRQAQLVRPAFGAEAALDNGERAFRRRTLHGGGEWEVCAQPVVPHTVVHLDVDAEEPLTRAQLERRAHIERHALGRAPEAAAPRFLLRNPNSIRRCLRPDGRGRH